MTDTSTITLTTFEAAGFKLRTFMKDGKLWLLGVDAARGYQLRNPSNAYARLAPDERTTLQRTEVGMEKGAPIVAVSESGFYKLVLRSYKPEALAFQDWVTREVLPAIRRTGGYRLAGVEPEAVEEGVTAEMPDVGGFTAIIRAEMTSLEQRFKEMVAAEVAKVLEAIQKTPNAQELEPTLKASEVAGLPFVPVMLSALQVGTMMREFCNANGFRIVETKGTFNGRPRTVRLYSLAAAKACFCPR